MMQERMLHFWEQMLTGEYENWSAYVKEFEEKNGLLLDAFYVPVLIYIFRWSRNSVIPMENQRFRAICRCFSRLASQEMEDSVVLNHGARSLLLIFPISGIAGVYHQQKTEIRNLCRLLLEQIEYDFDYACYIGLPETADHMPDTVYLLNQMFDSGVLQPKSISFINEISVSKSPVNFFKLELWVKLLSHGKKMEIEQEIVRILDRYFGDTFSLELAYSFYCNVMQACCAALYVNGILASDVWPEQDRSAKEASTVRSTVELKRFCHAYTRDTMNMIFKTQNAKSLIEQIMDYVSKRVGADESDLNRESVAMHFYLHPDYLTHLFRKETGKTFSEFLRNAKIRHAQHLLTTTEQSVSDIAYQVGYSSVAHFSAAFRKETGVSPSAYRKQEQQ